MFNPDDREQIDKEQIKAEVNSIQQEILKKKSPEEFRTLLQETKRLLLTEIENGEGKLPNKIEKIESETAFTDNRIRAVPEVKNGKILVVTDTHGWTEAVSQVLERFIKDKVTGENKIHLGSLGDMVANFGPAQLDNLAIFLELKRKYPKFVHLLKGNCDEGEWLMPAEGLAIELHKKTGVARIEANLSEISETVGLLPDWLVLKGSKVSLTHGAPPAQEISGLDELKKLDPEECFENWARIDPQAKGVSVAYDKDVSGKVSRMGLDHIKKFLDKIGGEWLIRGHEHLPGVKKQGYEIDGSVITFSSSPHYNFVKAEDGRYDLKAKIPHSRILHIPLDKPIEKWDESMFEEVKIEKKERAK